ncbi:hypothetical protein MKQ70_37075 [Chitinophaga sedimenti]|nr:hypothetical protein [Chitinophaga sedimenti]
MSGISSKAIYNPENRYKFNGIELNSDFDLYSYEARYRNLDPQIGRWWQIDPKPSVGISPFASMDLNPILNSDFLGDTSVPAKPVPVWYQVNRDAGTNQYQPSPLVSNSSGSNSSSTVMPSSNTTNETTANTSSNSQSNSSAATQTNTRTTLEKIPILGPSLIAAGSPLVPKVIVPNILFRSFVARGLVP